MLRAVGYLRVSTEEQVLNGVSLDAQEEKIKAYCIAKDLQLIRIIRDEGCSAKNPQRPGIQEIIANCKRSKFDAVIIIKLDRLTRSVKDLAYLVEDVFEKNHVAFTSIQDNFDTSTANGRMLKHIYTKLYAAVLKKIKRT
jgi:site-specific DNA recombinase